MKRLFKEIWSVFRRFRLSAALNLLGLSVAFSVFMVIMMQVYYDHQYNVGVSGSDRMALLYTETDDMKYTWISPVVVEELGQLPHVEAYTYFSPDRNAEGTFYQVDGKLAEGIEGAVAPNFPEVLGLEIVDGDRKCLYSSGHVMVPESFAEKFLGENPVGTVMERDGQQLIVGAVYRDLPKNTTFGNKVLLPITKEQTGGEEIWNNRYANFLCMLMRLDDASAMEQVESAANKTLADMKAAGTPDYNRLGYGLIPLRDVRYNEEVEGLPDFPAKKSTELMLLSVAVAIVVIAGINYVNFATALIPRRIRAINVRKILGESNASLRLYQLGESVAISLVSFCLSLGLVALLSGTSFARLSEAGLSIPTYGAVVWVTLAVSVATGLLGGLFPAFKMTSYSPAVVLKGNFGLSPKGRRFRNLMIGFQFFASSVLIVGAGMMQMQREFLVESGDYGFEKEALVVCDLRHGMSPDNISQVAEAMRKLPQVESASLSWSTLAERDNQQGWVFQTPAGEDVSPRTFFAKQDYFRTMGIDIIEGRDFNATDSNAIVVSRLTRDRYKEKVDIGRELRFGARKYTVVGVCENAKFSALYTEEEPVMVVCMPYFCNILNVRVKAGVNMFDTMEDIHRALAEFEPHYPFKVRFYDEILQNTYEKELLLTKQVSLFSLLAVFISVVGVFGLVTFDSEYRCREIAVRKVFGSSTMSVIVMFCRKYMAILFAAFVLAVPVATYAVGRWLENFAYQAPFGWWLFLAAFAILGAVTVLTVVVQCRRAAKANPIESLKYE